MKKLFSGLLLAGLVAVSPLWASEPGKTEGLLGPVLLGPKITAGLPVPFRLGLEGKFEKLLGFGFDYAFFPSLTFDEVSVSAKGWSLAGRIYPFQEALFVGLAFGKQDLSGTRTGQVDTGITTEVVNAVAEFNQTFIAPHIGWRWIWDSGLFFGMELGVQIPLSTSFTISTDRPDLEALPDAVSLKDQATAEADKYGDKPLPWIGLLQVGYFF